MRRRGEGNGERTFRTIPSFQSLAMVSDGVVSVGADDGGLRGAAGRKGEEEGKVLRACADGFLYARARPGRGGRPFPQFECEAASDVAQAHVMASSRTRCATAAFLRVLLRFRASGA